jgi:hypothetical protein
MKFMAITAHNIRSRSRRKKKEEEEAATMVQLHSQPWRQHLQ